MRNWGGSCSWNRGDDEKNRWGGKERRAPGPFVRLPSGKWRRGSSWRRGKEEQDGKIGRKSTHVTDFQKNPVAGLKHGNRCKHAVSYGISEAYMNASAPMIRLLRFYVVVFTKWAACLLIELAVIKICPVGLWYSQSGQTFFCVGDSDWRTCPQFLFFKKKKKKKTIN